MTYQLYLKQSEQVRILFVDWFDDIYLVYGKGITKIEYCFETNEDWYILSCRYFFVGGTTSPLGGGFLLDYIISTMENPALMYPLTGSYGYV